MLERTIVYNAPSAPYESHSFWQMLSEAAEDYYSSHTWKCQLYAALYNQLAKQFKERPIDIGSAESMRRVFDKTKTCPFFSHRPKKVKLGRWNNFFEVNAMWAGWTYSVLLIILYMGVKRCWWDALGTVPVLQKEPDEASWPSGPASAASPAANTHGGEPSGVPQGIGETQNATPRYQCE